MRVSGRSFEVHSYNDQVSVLKFIERNWHLGKISNRSRDNLPNPVMDRENPWVPVNMPAIGDLFDMFDFDHGQDSHDHDGDQNHRDHGNEINMTMITMAIVTTETGPNKSGSKVASAI